MPHRPIDVLRAAALRTAQSRTGARNVPGWTWLGTKVDSASGEVVDVFTRKAGGVTGVMELPQRRDEE